MKLLLQILLAAGLVWITSEIMELVMGGRTPVTLWLTAAFHLLIAFGFWGAYAGQEGSRSTASLVSAAMTSVGYFILIYPPIAVSSDPALTIGEYVNGNAFFRVGALLAVFGTIAFGAAALRTRSYRRWIAIALIACPAVSTIVLLADGPTLLFIGANMLQAAALIAAGKDGLRRMSRPTDFPLTA